MCNKLLDFFFLLLSIPIGSFSPIPAFYSCFFFFYCIFITVKIHTVNPSIGPVGIVGIILYPPRVSIQTHRFPSAVKTAEMSLVACHSYWQRPCKTHWVRWSKAPVNLRSTSLTPVARLWCKQSASRALVWPIQYAVCLLPWCNLAPHPISSLCFGFPSTCITMRDCCDWECEHFITITLQLLATD